MPVQQMNEGGISQYSLFVPVSGYHSNVRISQSEYQSNHFHPYVNQLWKFGKDWSSTFCQYFLPHRPTNYNFYHHNLRVSGPKFTKFVHDVEGSFALSIRIIRLSILQYSKSCRNAIVPNEGWVANLAPKLVAMVNVRWRIEKKSKMRAMSAV